MLILWSKAMLQLKGVTKSFPGAFAPALKNINLVLKPGDFCTVIGANGSGKSTLLKLISGEYSPDIGVVLLQGRADAHRSRLIAQVVQDINKGTIPEMTVLENIALSQMRTKRAKMAFYHRRHAKIARHIRALGLGEESLHQPLGHLSGGQRQIIATFMAIHSNPQILLLDEHTSALDPKMQRSVMDDTAQAIQERQLTTLMITHKMDEAITYGNRLIMLHKGEIIFEIDGAAKAALSVETLLALFHKYEDLSLRTEIPDDH